MIEAEQYFSFESLIARSTLAAVRPWPLTRIGTSPGRRQAGAGDALCEATRRHHIIGLVTQRGGPRRCHAGGSGPRRGSPSALAAGAAAAPPRQCRAVAAAAVIALGAH